MHDNDGDRNSNSNHNRNQKDVNFWLSDQNDNRAPGELVPDGFDLKAAKSKTSTTPKDQQPRCPNCGSIDLCPRNLSTARSGEDGLDYYCGRCNQRVDAAEPVPDGGDKLISDRYQTGDLAFGIGDVVIDLATGKSLQVVSKSTKTAGSHSEIRSDATAEMFGTDDGDPVYNCVFLPGGSDDVRPPSKTYAYPARRLLRYPVERAADGTNIQIHLRTAFLKDLAETAAEMDALEDLAAIVEKAYNEQMAEHARQWADAVRGGDELDDGGDDA